jgi:hypothetical protein
LTEEVAAIAPYDCLRCETTTAHMVDDDQGKLAAMGERLGP